MDADAPPHTRAIPELRKKMDWGEILIVAFIAGGIGMGVGEIRGETKARAECGVEYDGYDDQTQPERDPIK